MKNSRLLVCVIISVLLLVPAMFAYAQEETPSEAADGATRVYVILGIIIFLCGLFSGHDWSIFALRMANLDNPEIHSRYAKFCVTFLSAVMIWTAGQYAFDPADARRLAIAYSFIVLGDIIFFFNVHSRWGVCSFALAHFLLIRRNASGLSDWPSEGAMWAVLAAILVGTVAVMGLVFYPKLKENRPYFALLTGYAIIIGASVWAALIALKIGYFPDGNAMLIAWGVVFFFLSDVCVGFYRSLPKNYSMVFATYLTWIFYAPALVLTALSCFNLEKAFG